jgi:ABC-type branched-subunit amino acid transport system substrate-binding protein
MMKSYHSRDKFSISTVTAVVIAVIVIIAAVASGILLLTRSTTTGSTSSCAPIGSPPIPIPALTVPSTTVSSTTGSRAVNNITINFGATLSMTGSLSAFGQEQNWTLFQAVKDINSFGGIPLSNGSHAMVKLIVLDDGSDPTTASTNLATLVSTYHSTVILGELGGVQDSTAQNFATANKIPYIGPVYISAYKNSSNAANNWIFAPFQNETNEAHVFLNWFYSLDPPTSCHGVTIAFFGEGDPAALYNNQAGEAYARYLGYTVCSCSNLQFTPGDSSGMTSFIQAAKSAGAEAVYGLPLPPDAVLMANTAKQLNYVPKAWLLTRGTAVAPFAIPSIGGVGNESQGFMSSFPWDPSVPYQGNLLGHIVNNSQIVSEYLAAFGHPPTLEGVYYTEALIAADAIASAGTLSNTAIRQALLSGTFQTPMGTVNFSPGGQWIQSQEYILLMQWQNRNIPNLGVTPTLQILEPRAINTTSYVYYPFSFYTNATNQKILACPC